MLKELEERQRRLYEAEAKRQQVEKDLEAHQNHQHHRHKVPLKQGDERSENGGGLMRRSFSHSSPNIAKMMEDEDNATSGKLIQNIATTRH